MRDPLDRNVSVIFCSNAGVRNTIIRLWVLNYLSTSPSKVARWPQQCTACFWLVVCTDSNFLRTEICIDNFCNLCYFFKRQFIYSFKNNNIYELNVWSFLNVSVASKANFFPAQSSLVDEMILEAIQIPLWSLGQGILVITAEIRNLVKILVIAA